MSASVLTSIPGGQALVDWFGFAHRFHDAEMQDITLASGGSSTLRLRTWRITNALDGRGYFILDKHVIVTIVLEEITYVALEHFNLPGIVHDLDMTGVAGGFQVRWTGSYGIEGTLMAKSIRIDFTPTEPDRPPP
jgi:hypothetical protein